MPLIPWPLLSVDAMLESVEDPSDAKEACRRGGDWDGDVLLPFLYQICRELLITEALYSSFRNLFAVEDLLTDSTELALSSPCLGVKRRGIVCSEYSCPGKECRFYV